MRPTEIDLAQAEYYKKFPELIIETEAWGPLRYCRNCGGLLSATDPCLYHTRNGFNARVNTEQWERSNGEGKSVKHSHIGCPHCAIGNNVTFWNKKLPKKKGEKQLYRQTDSVINSDPILFDVIFRRKVWTEKRKEIKGSWWRKTRYEGEDKFFWEYTNLIDESENPDKTEP